MIQSVWRKQYKVTKDTIPPPFGSGVFDTNGGGAGGPSAFTASLAAALPRPDNLFFREQAKIISEVTQRIARNLAAPPSAGGSNGASTDVLVAAPPLPPPTSPPLPSSSAVINNKNKNNLNSSRRTSSLSGDIHYNGGGVVNVGNDELMEEFPISAAAVADNDGNHDIVAASPVIMEEVGEQSPLTGGRRESNIDGATHSDSAAAAVVFVANTNVGDEVDIELAESIPLTVREPANAAVSPTLNSPHSPLIQQSRSVGDLSSSAHSVVIVETEGR